MNQILITKENYYIYNNLLNYKKKYLYILSFFIIICLLIIFYLIYSYFLRLNNNTTTSQLKNKYNINSLYSSNTYYSSIKLSNDISIIGLIEIPKINISYPILSNTNEDLLKISTCRFSGPLPNRIGNLCIAGHNYNNSLMFSKLYKLNISDSIFITDLNNIKLEYIIYDKFTVRENNLDCIKNSNNIELTLITCNERNNSKRLVIKAKVKGY